MKMTLDFDNDLIITDNSRHVYPGLSEKKAEILKLLDMQEMPMQDLKNDINALFKELGFNNVNC